MTTGVAAKIRIKNIPNTNPKAFRRKPVCLIIFTSFQTNRAQSNTSKYSSFPTSKLYRPVVELSTDLFGFKLTGNVQVEFCDSLTCVT
jgi:hypothetical protein